MWGGPTGRPTLVSGVLERDGRLCPVDFVTLALGGLLTIGGAGALVIAFRHGQAGRTDAEQRWFRVAVAGLALGSAAFLATVLLAR